MHLDKLLKQPNALPSAPKVVRKLIESFEQEEVDPMRIASLIEDDPVLTARLLKTANSAFFGLSRNVTNAREAMNILGLIKVRAMVVAIALGALQFDLEPVLEVAAVVNTGQHVGNR